MSHQVTDQSPDQTREGTWQRLDSISQLLHHAARQLWVRADEDGPGSAMHSLALGVYLAHAQAHQLLPEHHDAVGVDRVDDDRTASQLLTEAEQLSQLLPPGRTDLATAPRLVLDLCDLIREAQHHDR